MGVAGQQVHAVVAQVPGAGLPGRAGERRRSRAPAGAGHSRPAHPAPEHAAQAGPLHLVVQARLEGVDVDRQPALAPQEVEDVLVGGMDVLVGEPQPRRELADEAFGILRRVVQGRAFVGEQRGLRQQGWPSARQQIDRSSAATARPGTTCPGRSAGSRPRRTAPAACAPVRRHSPLGRAQRIGVPFRGVAIADGDEGRLAAHGEAHVAGLQFAVDRIAGASTALLLGVRPGHARRFMDARDLHVVGELHLGLVDEALDRRRAEGCGVHANVAFAGHQAGGGVQADPARAGQVDLAPGMQVGEVDFGAARAVQGLHVRLQLDQVTGDEARGQAQPAQQLHQQPARIAAGAARQLQRLLRRRRAPCGSGTSHRAAPAGSAPPGSRSWRACGGRSSPGSPAPAASAARSAGRGPVPRRAPARTGRETSPRRSRKKSKGCRPPSPRRGPRSP